MAESVAEKAGLKADDRIVEAAGTPMSQVKDVIAVVRRQAFGSWLPIKVERDGESLDIVAKFPPPS
jgi:S1-C subfamily serine protease